MMDNNRAGYLPLQLFGAYAAALFGGSLFIFVNNIVINGRTIGQLLKFNIPFVLLSDIILALLLSAITHWRLYEVFRYFRGRNPDMPKQLVFERLMRFPGELFGGMIILSLLFIALFHGSDFFFYDLKLDSLDRLIRLANVVLSELSLALILAVLLFTAARRLLRTYALRLEIEEIPGPHIHTAVRLLTVCAVVSFVITFSAASRILPKTGRGWDTLSLLGLPAIYAAFSAGILAFYALELRKELRMLIDGLQKLAEGTKSSLHQTFPIISINETGRLAAAVNEVQTRIGQAYIEVERQLKLAYNVQQQLLPNQLAVSPSLDIAASCQQCHEVGGDFYDVIRIGESRYCIAIGDVSGKGLPAALLMSAAMTGLRTEAVKGGTAGDILTRMNRHIYQMTRGRMYSTAGLAIIDLSSDAASLDYASAGHLDPYLIRHGELTEWPCSSLPLGISPDTVYQGTSYTLETGDIFLMYTDGIVESGQSSGEMFGFDRWEQELRRISPKQPVDEQLGALLGRMGHTDHQAGLHDDQTVVFVQWKGSKCL